MVFLPKNLSRTPLQVHQVLSRDTEDDDQYGWGPMQITAPIVVGVVLIVIFIAFIIWHKRSPHNSPIAHHYSRVRDACVSRFTRFFMPGRRRRRRVQHVSTPITLDDSMVTPRQMRRPHHSYSSDSTDSQTPLTDTVEFYYPPQKYADPSGRPILGAPQQSERRTWRWWRFFGLGPHKVTSQVPSHRFQIEGPDESSVGHGDGDGSLGSPIVAVGSGWTSGLPALCEQDEGDPQRGFYDRVIQIGDPQVTIHSTPRIPAHYEDVAVAAPPGSVPSSAKTPAPEYRSTAEFPYTTSNLRNTTTVPTTVIPQISYHTTGPTHSDSPEPPVYSSVSRSEHPSVESIIHPARSDPTMLYPGSVRAAGRSLPRMYQAHERQASTESVLSSSTPMVTQGLY